MNFGAKIRHFFFKRNFKFWEQFVISVREGMREAKTTIIIGDPFYLPF